jgi:hypothetical protein
MIVHDGRVVPVAVGDRLVASERLVAARPAAIKPQMATLVHDEFEGIGCVLVAGPRGENDLIEVVRLDPELNGKGRVSARCEGGRHSELERCSGLVQIDRSIRAVRARGRLNIDLTGHSICSQSPPL